MIVSYGQHFDYKQKPMIIFNHIAKCGGTTFKQILIKHFLEKKFFIYNCNRFIHFFLLIDQLKKEFEKYNVLFMGHFTWGLHNYLNYNKKVYYISLIRDPWSRFVSQYKFYFIKRYFSYDIFTFFDKDYEHNFLTNRLGNGDLELAKDNLEKKHYLFGIVERYDDFLKMFAYFFQINSINYDIYNKSNPKVINDSNLFKLKENFIKRNELDYELYRFAKELFNKRFNAIKGVVNSINIKRSSKEVMAERDENIVKIFVNKDLSLESKEVFLKKAIIYKPHFDLDINIDLLIEFYKRNKK